MARGVIHAVIHTSPNDAGMPLSQGDDGAYTVLKMALYSAIVWRHEEVLNGMHAQQIKTK